MKVKDILRKQKQKTKKPPPLNGWSSGFWVVKKKEGCLWIIFLKLVPLAAKHSQSNGLGLNRDWLLQAETQILGIWLEWLT